MFGCSTNMNQTGVMPLNKNVKRLLIHIISYLESGEVVDPVSKKVNVYRGKSVFCIKERVKSIMHNFFVEYLSVFHGG